MSNRIVVIWDGVNRSILFWLCSFYNKGRPFSYCIYVYISPPSPRLHIWQRLAVDFPSAWASSTLNHQVVDARVKCIPHIGCCLHRYNDLVKLSRQLLNCKAGLTMKALQCWWDISLFSSIRLRKQISNHFPLPPVCWILNYSGNHPVLILQTYFVCFLKAYTSKIFHRWN